jgi:hypothetical protein
MYSALLDNTTLKALFWLLTYLGTFKTHLLNIITFLFISKWKQMTGQFMFKAAKSLRKYPN